MRVNQEGFEREIMSRLLHGEHPDLSVLRAQLEAATVSGREFSGIGFFTSYDVPATAPKTQRASFNLTDVRYELRGVENGGGVVLFVKNHVLEMLEVYNWTDPWPDELEIVDVSYLTAKTSHAANTKELYPSPERDEAALVQEMDGQI